MVVKRGLPTYYYCRDNKKYRQAYPLASNRNRGIFVLEGVRIKDALAV